MNYHIIISDGVFISKEPKPTELDFTFSGGVTYSLYIKALRKWEDQLIPVENVIDWNNGIFGLDKGIGHPHAHLIADIPLQEGQQVTAEIKDGKATITKIQ